MEEESKRDRFLRIATKRVNQVLNGYRLLSNLKSGNYDSTSEQRRELVNVLRRGLEELELIFAGEKPDKTNFKFSSGQVNGHDSEDPEETEELNS